MMTTIICVYIYIYICMYIYIYIYICTRNVWMDACVYIYIYIYICMYVCVCMYPYLFISIRPSLSIYMSKYQPIYLHICFYSVIWSLQRGAQHAAVRSSEASASSRPLRGPSSGGRAPGKSVRKERRLTATTMEPVMMLLLMMISRCAEDVCFRF